MFYLTESGRLQNLSLLQDVKVTKTIKELKDKTETIYHVGYVQINGEIVNEGEYATEAEAKLKVDTVVANLLA